METFDISDERGVGVVPLALALPLAPSRDIKHVRVLYVDLG